MYMNALHPDSLGAFFGIAPAIAIILVAVAALWTIVWKGFGLWHAARDGQKWWFLAFLIINDLGILEIIYLVWFRKQRTNETPSLFETPAVSESSAPAE